MRGVAAERVEAEAAAAGAATSQIKGLRKLKTEAPRTLKIAVWRERPLKNARIFVKSTGRKQEEDSQVN